MDRLFPNDRTPDLDSGKPAEIAGRCGAIFRTVQATNDIQAVTKALRVTRRWGLWDFNHAAREIEPGLWRVRIAWMND